ncbi:hypothetical protein PG984_011718 [Apiospora sp. TS-2023a]
MDELLGSKSAPTRLTLRVLSTGSSVRCVNQDTVIGGKLLRRGNKIIIPFRLLHLDEEVSKGGGAARAQGSSRRPFGGGNTVCTGRFVAEHMIKSCVAIILRRFDLSVLDGAQVPRGDEGTPGLGIMGLRAGDDFKVKITARVLDN